MQKQSVLFLMLILAAVSVAPGQKNKTPYPYPQPQVRPGQGPNASPEQNKAAARRVFEAYTQGRFEEANQIYAPNCRVQFGGQSESLGQAIAEARGWKSAAPDLVITPNQITVTGDMVTVNWTARGTHTGQGNGLKPTGKHINMHGTSQFRFANGKIVEATTTEYRSELFRQLGVSKTAASMVDTTEKLWSAVRKLFPDPLYASLQ